MIAVITLLMLAIRNRSVVAAASGTSSVRTPIAAVWMISPSTLRANDAAVDPSPMMRRRRYASVAAQPVSGGSVVVVLDETPIASVVVVPVPVEVTSEVRSPAEGAATVGPDPDSSAAAVGPSAEAAA